jgi:hypothetical protein
MLSTLLRKPVRIDLSEQPCPTQPTSGSGLSREQLIDRIIALNPSATALFLAQFRENALECYLNHLMLAATPRGRDACRVRPRGQSWAAEARASA